MKLIHLLSEAGYEMPQGLHSCEITGITADSRCVEPGMLFVALTGLSHDGFCYLREAFARGAAFVVSERQAEGLPCLVVDDSRAALARLFDAWYGHPARGLSLIGITGTNGKTSTAAMLYAILRSAGYRCGLIGTVECLLNDQPIVMKNDDRLANMTTPDPAQLYALLAKMRDGGVTHVVMEVTSHALAFRKTEPLLFKRGVFTNLTPDHLDLHGDMESYFLEKQKLFECCEGAVISCFGAYGVRLADHLNIPLWRLDAQTVTDIKQKGSQGVEFTLCSVQDSCIRLSLPIPGVFSVENGALAAMTALSLGVDVNTVTAALSSFRGVRGRMERADEDQQDVSVFLDYAHTPDALEKLLYTVRGFCRPEQRITVLFGCGGDRDRSKRAEMGRVASRLADFVILTSDNCRSERPEDILKDILRGVDKEKPYQVIVDRKKAIEFAVREARKGDILILAGKGHEEYEICGRERRHFSEREIVAECLAHRAEGKHAN